MSGALGGCFSPASRCCVRGADLKGRSEKSASSGMTQAAMSGCEALGWMWIRSSLGLVR